MSNFIRYHHKALLTNFSSNFSAKTSQRTQYYQNAERLLSLMNFSKTTFSKKQQKSCFNRRKNSVPYSANISKRPSLFLRNPIPTLLRSSKSKSKNSMSLYQSSTRVRAAVLIILSQNRSKKEEAVSFSKILSKKYSQMNKKILKMNTNNNS